LSFLATRWHGPARALDDEARWDAARRLLHDDTLATRDCLAGLLVLLYAQPVARISRLTTDQVTLDDTTVRIPPRISAHHAARPRRRPHPATPGRQTRTRHHRRRPPLTLAVPRRPARPPDQRHHLGQRLKDLGIQPGPARSTALFQLATELPAALLARMLGIHIGVAVAWQRASAGDWTHYAADVSRRTRRQDAST
jgi:hypothetical protein